MPLNNPHRTFDNKVKSYFKEAGESNPLFGKNSVPTKMEASRAVIPNAVGIAGQYSHKVRLVG